MRIHLIIHEAFEAPGAIEDRAQARNYSITYTLCYAGDSFPIDTNHFDLLIVMGGPQSPTTTSEECPHFNAESEIMFIKQAIQKQKKLLGICLGAQLIGEALGAPFEHSPNREIGMFPITMTEAGKSNPFFSRLPKTFNVGHWHGDMPGLTPNAEIIAWSEGCPRQIIKYAENIYGFQCHFEFTSESIRGMIIHCGHELETYKHLSYIEQADKLKSHNYTDMNQYLFAFLDYMVAI